jgi:hypothetical protein
VLAKRGGKSLIHYLDFSSSFDEWVTADRIKLRGAPVPTLKAPPPAAGPANDGGPEGLYYRSVVIPKETSPNGAESVQTYPYWFLADGNVLGGSWDALIDYLDGGLDQYKRKQAQFWGTFKKEEGAVVITWSGGREQRFATDPAAAGVMRGLYRAYPVKPGAKLEGKYILRTGAWQAGQKSSVGTMIFHKDMTIGYTDDIVDISREVKGSDGSVKTDSYRGVGVALGTYRFDGYRLSIKTPEWTRSMPAWVFSEEESQSESPRMISLRQEVFHRQD